MIFGHGLLAIRQRREGVERGGSLLGCCELMRKEDQVISLAFLNGEEIGRKDGQEAWVITEAERMGGQS